MTISNDCYCELIEQARTRFEHDPAYATEQILKGFQVWKQLMEQDNAALASKSPSTRSNELRSRQKLLMILNKLGPGVLLLCTLATSKSKFFQVQAGGLSISLKQWWSSVQHPPELGNTIAQVNRAYPGWCAKEPRAEYRADHWEVGSTIQENDHKEASGGFGWPPSLEYSCSSALLSRLTTLLSQDLVRAVKESKQWQLEQEIHPSARTDCCMVLVPKSPHDDVSILLRVSQRRGVDIMQSLEMSITPYGIES